MPNTAMSISFTAIDIFASTENFLLFPIIFIHRTRKSVGARWNRYWLFLLLTVRYHSNNGSIQQASLFYLIPFREGSIIIIIHKYFSF